LSQVSIIDIEGNHPQIPTRFNANIGFAIPIANVLEIFGDTTPAGTNPVHTVGTGNNITTYVQITQAIAASNLSNVGLAAFDEDFFSVDANGFVSFIGVTQDLHVARFIVSAGGTADGANYTTFAAAYAAAVSAGGNQTIFLQPGTYNIGTQVLAAGINVAAFDCDAQTPNVTINGKMTANITGTCSFSGIHFVNNSDNILAVSGSGGCVFNFNECFIEVGGNFKAFLNTNPNCGIIIATSEGDITGTDVYFDMTGGAVSIRTSFFFNGTNDTTQNIFSNASFDLENATFDSAIIATGTGGDVSVKHSTMILLDATLITTSGGPNDDLVIFESHIDSNNATAISIGAGSTMKIVESSVGSSATDAIDGAGVLLYTPISFTKSSSNVTTATQTPMRFGPSISPIMPNAYGTVYYDGTIITTADAGSATDVWTSNGPGVAPSFQPVAASGDVSGPGSSTDRSIPTWDGTSGQLLQDNPNAIIDANGVYTNTDQPAFYAYLNANTATNKTGDGTFATFEYDTLAFERGGSNFNTGTHEYTIPKSGFWEFTFTPYCYRVAGTNNVMLVNLNVNGTNFRLYEVDFENCNSSGELILNGTWANLLTAGDVVKVVVAVGGAAANIGFGGGSTLNAFIGRLLF